MNTPPTQTIRICFVMPKAYPLFAQESSEYFGGAELDLFMLSTELAKDSRFQVSFIVADYGQPLIEERRNVRLINGVNFSQGGWKNAKSLWQAMKTADAQIYFFKTPSAGLYLGHLFCRLHHRWLAYRTASCEETDGTFAHKHPGKAKLFHRVLKKAVWVFTQNETDAQYLRQNLGLIAHPIKNGHIISEPPIDPIRSSVLWVGRSAPLKNPHLFFQLTRKYPQHHFTMICRHATGDTNYQHIEQLAEQLPNLEFISDVPFEKIQDYFQQAKLFINTSTSEGFPNTFIQACLAATPILSFNVNPDHFLNHFDCGRCAESDWSKFCRFFEELIQPELAWELGQNAYQYARDHHDIKMIVNHYKQLFVTQS